jgi:hypothetical protein
MSHIEQAREYLHQLRVRHGGGGRPDEEDVQQLAALIERLIGEERQACLRIVEDAVQLFGSHTAEMAANRIRARGEDIA